jgi:hypothetical protein
LDGGDAKAQSKSLSANLIGSLLVPYDSGKLAVAVRLTPQLRPSHASSLTLSLTLLVHLGSGWNFSSTAVGANAQS